MKPRFFTIPNKAQYQFFLKEAGSRHPQATLEIRKTDYTIDGWNRFSVVRDIQEFDALIPLIEARKRELIETASKGRRMRADPHKVSKASHFAIDKVERVFNQELLDAQVILHAYNRIKRGEIQLKQEL